MHECVRVIGTAHTAVREGILSPFAACAPSIAPQNGAYAIGAQNDEMRDETDRRCVSACGEVKSPLRMCCTTEWQKLAEDQATETPNFFPRTVFSQLK